MDTDHGGDADEAEAAFFAHRGRRCCCFPCWPSSSYSATTTSSSLSHQRLGAAGAAGAEEEPWWQGGADALLKVREWSELAAGPRWKTFIRRFGRNGGGPRPHNNFGRKLNYDALSYALNFDEGPGATPEAGDHAAFRDFSSRFAAPPASAKSSMDLGGRDAPPLFAPPPADGAGRAWPRAHLPPSADLTR